MAENATSAAATAAETTPATGTTETAAATEGQKQGESKESTPLTAEAIEKIVQSRVDKITAQLGKEKAEAVAELEKMKKDKMSADELQKYELKKEKDALAAREKEITDKGNRITAINELTKAELYDGSETANTLLNMIVTGVKDESEIIANVKAFKSVVDKLVAAQVDKTFKANGRIPNGGDKTEAGTNKNLSIAEKLGKEAAANAEKSNKILNYYYGGNK